MALEALLEGLIAALNANTEALKASGGSGKAPSAAAASKPAPTAASKPAASAATDSAADPAKLAKARDELKKVLDSKGSDEVRKILSEVGATKLSEVKGDKVDDLFAAINKRLAPEAGGGAMFD